MMITVWKLKPYSQRARSLAHETDISILKAQLLINRGISDSGSVVSFLSPRLSNLIDPMLMKDMDAAIELILRTLEDRKPITIYGDYDADGITATALLMNFFSDLGIPVSFHIPNRLEEGYGLNPRAVEKIAKRGAGLIITVDCGTTNLEEIELAKRLGMDVVVTDHHQVQEDFNPICPVLNSHRPDSSFSFKNLAGVGLSFFLAIAIRASLRERGWFVNSPEPDLKHYLDLVALGTVADMVPLLGQNRILVHAGIETMKTSKWPGIKALQKISEVDSSNITTYDLAFRLAPRLNAPGRLGESEMGIYTLTTDKPPIAMDLASQLNTMNNQRQTIERDIIEQIDETIMSRNDLQHRRTLVFSEEGWHKGVLGIVASRLLNIYHRPTLVLTIQNGMATGSGRSIDGFDLHQAFTRLEHLFERFGGHYHAAGFTIQESNIEALAVGLEDLAQEDLSEEDLIPVIDVDTEVKLSDLTMETVREIRSLSPFGAGNPEPIYYAHSLQVIGSRIVGERHLKLRVKQGENVMEAIGFGLAEMHPLEGKIINMVFSPVIDEWQGYERLQLKMIDLEMATPHHSKLIGR